MGANLKISRIQKRGQVTIPIEIRQKLHLEEGDLVAFIETKEGIVLSPQEIVPAETGNKVESLRQQKSGTLDELFTFGQRLAQGQLGGAPSPASPGEPSIVEQTAGIFRQRQGGESGAIDFDLARQLLSSTLRNRPLMKPATATRNSHALHRF